MSSSFACGSQYFYLSNRRAFVFIEAAIELASELAESDQQKQFTAKFDSWWKAESYPGIDISLEKLFPTVDEQKFWAQVFECLGWRVYQRRWGNQENETWQVGFISHCHLISLMLNSLVWQVDRHWYPTPADFDGISPDLCEFSNKLHFCSVAKTSSLSALRPPKIQI